MTDAHDVLQNVMNTLKWLNFSNMHTCIFLCCIERINPHGDALRRNVLPPLNLVQYVSWNVAAPGYFFIHCVVMFLTEHLKPNMRRNYMCCVSGTF